MTKLTPKYLSGEILSVNKKTLFLAAPLTFREMKLERLSLNYLKPSLILQIHAVDHLLVLFSREPGLTKQTLCSGGGAGCRGEEEKSIDVLA